MRVCQRCCEALPDEAGEYWRYCRRCQASAKDRSGLPSLMRAAGLSPKDLAADGELTPEQEEAMSEYIWSEAARLRESQWSEAERQKRGAGKRVAADVPDMSVSGWTKEGSPIWRAM